MDMAKVKVMKEHNIWIVDAASTMLRYAMLCYVMLLKRAYKKGIEIYKKTISPDTFSISKTQLNI